MSSGWRRDVHVLCVPTEAGTHWPGQSKAPEAALGTGGLISKLEATGSHVHVHDRVFSDAVSARAAAWRPAPKRNGVRNEENTLVVMHAVRDYIRDNRQTLLDSFPLIIGGDCSITPAVFSGLCGLHDGSTRVGLLYIDGDADLTLPEQTDGDGSTAILDAMTISHLTGRHGGLESMRAFAASNGSPLVSPDNIVLFGFDPLQPATEHWIYLLENRFKAFTCPTVRSNPLASVREAIAWLRAIVDVIYVHFDVDVVSNWMFASMLPNCLCFHFGKHVEKSVLTLDLII